jgi:hypothetical protein
MATYYGLSIIELDLVLTAGWDLDNMVCSFIQWRKWPLGPRRPEDVYGFMSWNQTQAEWTVQVGQQQAVRSDYPTGNYYWFCG